MTTLDFSELRRSNIARRALWHPPNSVPWSGADWSNAMQGEAGEFGNVVKKLRRHETGVATHRDPPIPDLLAKLADEAADTVIYLDLATDYYGINLGWAALRKFNAVSEREGYPILLRSNSWGSNPQFRDLVRYHLWHDQRVECGGCLHCA